MKVNFYFRLFFIFFIFSSLSVYLAVHFGFDDKIKKEQVSNMDKTFLNLQLKAMYINRSIELIKERIKTNIDLEDKNILETNRIDLNQDSSILKGKDYYFKYIEKPFKNKTFKKIAIKNRLYILYKNNNTLLEVIYDLSPLFKVKSDLNIYSVFLYEKQGNSKYIFDIGNTKGLNQFNSNTQLKTLFPSDYKAILNYDSYNTKEFSSKKIVVTDSLSYVIIFKPTKITFKDKLDTYLSDSIVVILFFMIFASFILALVFSNLKSIFSFDFYSKDNDKQKSKKGTKELSESLDFIDKNVIVLKTTLSGEITDVSSALCEFTKYSENELIGHDLKKFLTKELSNKGFENIWKNIKSGKTKTIEVKGLKKDGDEFWLNTLVEPILNEFDEVIGLNFINENITQKKKIEQIYINLDYQLSQYNAVFDNVNNGIAIMDLNGRFKKFNESFSKIFSYSVKQLNEKISFKDLLNENDKSIEKILSDIKELRKISNIEKVFLNSEKVKIHLEMTMSILPDNKSIVLIVSSLKDKRKQQEINQLLEQKIAEELEKSRQKDEIHKQEQIKNAKLTSIGSLAAGITHEINTPLTYIKGSFELMGYDIEDLPNSDIKTRMLEDKTKIDDGLVRIANIVESMREISQKTTETKELTNIYSTLITVLTMAYNRSKQVVPIYIKDELFEIGDLDKNKFQYYSKVQKQRIEQVWIIIINNALDELVKIDNYDDRSLKIEIFVENKEIVIKFKDNAGGIPTDILPKVFDPFVSNKEHSGMGVGLNIAKSIVDQQDGSIKAFNNENGAIFEVRLLEYKDEGIS